MIWDDKGAWGWDTSDCAAFRSFDGTFFMGIDATYDPPPGDHHLLLLPAPPLLPALFPLAVGCWQVADDLNVLGVVRALLCDLVGLCAGGVAVHRSRHPGLRIGR